MTCWSPLEFCHRGPILFLFKQRLPGWVEQIADAEHRKIVHRYATWRVLCQLRDTATRQPIGHYRKQSARHKICVATTFLDYLTSIDVPLGRCRQGDLDHWFVTTIGSTRSVSRSFIGWVVASGHMPRLRRPATRDQASLLISLQQRLELLRRIHTGPDMKPIDRVVAL